MPGRMPRSDQQEMCIRDRTHDTTLGVSNEIVADEAEISFTEGRLLVILSGDMDQKQR